MAAHVWNPIIAGDGSISHYCSPVWLILVLGESNLVHFQ